jgi:hypothetical protein
VGREVQVVGTTQIGSDTKELVRKYLQSLPRKQAAVRVGHSLREGEPVLCYELQHEGAKIIDDVSHQQHLALAMAQFLVMTSQKVKVQSVKLYVNPGQLRRYQKMQHTFLHNGRPTEERWVFHGTHPGAVEAIMCEGFRVGGMDTKVRNGMAHGKGKKSSALRSGGGRRTLDAAVKNIGSPSCCGAGC